jgi:hypothetical protein
MTPLEYEALYKNLKVEFVDATPAVTLSINKYWLKSVQPEGQKIIDETRNQIAKNKLEVKVNGTVVTLAKFDDELNRRLRYALAGKGSPEDYQMVVQLAVLTGRPTGGTTTADLQAYCDKNLGMDCNGFVGNYLWHLKNPWPALFPTDAKIKRGDAPNSDMTVDGFFDRGRAIGSLDKIQPAELNVFGMVDGTTFDLVPHVITTNGEVTEDAHIVISEPGKFQKLSPGPGIKLYIVESTGYSSKLGIAPGLTDNWCTVTESLDEKGKPRNTRNYPALRVFKVYRDSKKQEDLFAICSFPVS